MIQFCIIYINLFICLFVDINCDFFFKSSDLEIPQVTSVTADTFYNNCILASKDSDGVASASASSTAFTNYLVELQNFDKAVPVNSTIYPKSPVSLQRTNSQSMTYSSNGNSNAMW